MSEELNLNAIEAKRVELEVSLKSDEQKSIELRRQERKALVRFQRSLSDFEQVKAQLLEDRGVKTDSKIDQKRLGQLTTLLRSKGKDVKNNNVIHRQARCESDQSIAQVTQGRRRIEQLQAMVSQVKIQKAQLREEMEFGETVQLSIGSAAKLSDTKVMPSKTLLDDEVEDQDFEDVLACDQANSIEDNVQTTLDSDYVNDSGMVQDYSQSCEGSDYSGTSQNSSTLTTSVSPQVLVSQSQTCRADSFRSLLNSYQSFVSEVESFKTGNRSGVNFKFISESGHPVNVEVVDLGSGKVRLSLAANNSQEQRVLWREKGRIIEVLKRAGIKIGELKVSGTNRKLARGSN